MSILWLRRTLTALFVAGIGSITMIAAQGPTTGSADGVWTGSPSELTGSPTEQLLLEVRELKSEINQAVGASIRAQLLVARLQLQEQRIYTLGGQLSEVRRLLKNLDQGQTPIAGRLKQFEDAMQNPSTPSEALRAMEAEMPQLRTRFEQMQQQEQQLRMQESQLSTQLAAEQSRWMDFNSRLDELERQLPSR